jgi:transcriptional regulator
MYRPPAFKEDSLEAQHELIVERPFGWLVTTGSLGILADPVPFALDAGAGDFGTLRAHFSRANAQLQALSESEECLVIFQGPDAYITPEWYETKRETGKVVPTWNYVAVHAWGRPQIIEDAAWLRAQIDGLTELMEGRRPRPWAVTDAPASYIDSQLKGIFGVEIPIARIEGKWKASQNQPEKNRVGVAEGLRLEGNEPMAAVVFKDPNGVTRSDSA